MPDINGNMKKFIAIGPNGQKYIMIPIDTEARKAIDEAKDLEFDEGVFNIEETDSSVKVGAHLVPIGVDDETPLEIVQDTAEGLVLGSKAPFSTALAPAFNATSTYAVGDTVTYKGKLYKCTTAVQTAGEWTGSTNWTETQVSSAVKDISVKANNPLKLTESGNNAIMEADTIFSANIAAGYNTSYSYAVGDVVSYNNKIYRCTAATTGNWDSTKWSETSLSNVRKVAAAANNPMQVSSVSADGVTLSVDSVFSGSIASAYDSALSYYPGDKVVYQNRLYKCTANTSGSWDSTKWTAATATYNDNKVFTYGSQGTCAQVIAARLSGRYAYCYFSADETVSGYAITIPNGTLLKFSFADSNYVQYFSGAIQTVNSNTSEVTEGILVAKFTPSGSTYDTWSLSYIPLSRLTNLCNGLNSGNHYAGDIMTYNGKIYVANKSSSGATFRSADWDETKIDRLLSAINIGKFTIKTTAALSAISGSKAVKIYLGNGLEYQLALVNAGLGKCTFLSETIDMGSDDSYPPNSTYAGVGLKLQNGADVTSDERQAVIGGIYDNTSVSPVVSGTKTTLTIPNNTHVNIGTITTSNLEIVIKSSDGFKQAPHAAFEFAKATGTGNFNVSVKYETENVTRSLNLVCPGWISGGSTTLYLYTGSYGLHIMGNTGIITVIETDAPST